MGIKPKDGIIIDSHIDINDEKKEQLSVLFLIFQLVIMITGSWSFTSILIESFLIPVSETEVFFSLIIFSILFFIYFQFPRYGAVKAFFTILFYSLFCYSRWSRLQNAFYILENLVIRRINEYYETSIVYYKADYLTAQADTTLFLILIIIPLTFFFAAAIKGSKFHSICMILLFLPVISSFAIGSVPSEEKLVAAILSMIFISKSFGAESSNEDDNASIKYRVYRKSALFLCFASMILFLLLKTLISPSYYKEIAKVEEAKTKLQNFLYDFTLEDVAGSIQNIRMRGQEVSTGGLSGGRLGRTGQVNFSNTEHLRLTVPLPSALGGIYLKGFVGSIYTGDSWEENSRDLKQPYEKIQEQLVDGEFIPVNQVSLLLDNLAKDEDGLHNSKKTTEVTSDLEYRFYQGKMKVEYKGANRNYLYVPYFTDYRTLETIEYIQDLQDLNIFSRDKNDSYEVGYYFDLSIGSSFDEGFHEELLQRLSSYSYYEKIYRDYVYDVYTRLPKKGLDQLKHDFSHINTEKKYKEIPDKIQYVKDYLNSHTQYSLSPGRLPQGKDFVEYFLYENQLGYCAHYASAATLMLRAMGVPARYIEGYSVGSGDISQSDSLEDQQLIEYSDKAVHSYGVRQLELSVRDYNAHAWVEVYIDGSGWIPVEFTPGSVLGSTQEVISDLAQIGEEINRNEQEVPTTGPDTPTPSLIEQNTEEGLTDSKEDPKETNIRNQEEPGGKFHKGSYLGLAFFLVILSGLGVLIICLLYRIYNKKKLIIKSNRSQRALLLYEVLEKIIADFYGHSKERDYLEENIEYIKKDYPYFKTEEFEDFLKLIVKARFGKRIISSSELMKAMDFFQTTYTMAYQNSSFRKKLSLKLQLLL